MPTPFRLNFAEMDQAQPGLAQRFALLGLFPADYSIALEEASAVWSVDDPATGQVQASLDLLLARRLLDRTSDRVPLYRMPGVVRQLAEGALAAAPDLRRAGETALISYYAAFATAHGEGLPDDITAMADVYDAANTALAWAEQAGRWPAASALARGLCRFLYVRHMGNQYRDLLRRGMYAATEGRQLLDQAWFLREQGGLAAESSQWVLAADFFEQSINICRELGEERGEAQGLYEWGRMEIAQGHYETGRHLMNESMDIMRELQHGVLQPATLHELAELSVKQGHHEQAVRELQEALNAEVDRGDLAAQARTLHELGDLQANRGRSQPAVEYYLRSLTLDRQRQDRYHGGLNLTALGLQAMLASDTNTATRCWLAALALLQAEKAPEAADVDHALDRLLGVARVTLPPDVSRRALAEWWGA
ncbi:MAG TPA: tetratricopeptide repeat protein [Chloroflexia bacterium]|nr:tetratricopeptide repeat protein [Chloroflexia bacterium]